MNAADQRLHERLSASALPQGWTCEKDAWGASTHLVAPKRVGGIIVKARRVSVQVPSTGPSSPRVEIMDGLGRHDFQGRGWQDRIVEAAVRAAWRFDNISNQVTKATDYLDWHDLPARPR